VDNDFVHAGAVMGRARQRLQMHHPNHRTTPSK
jgi:hypothetical protein